MEIGQKVTWVISNKIMLGLFMEEKDGIAEIICYQMGDINCRLRVCINIELLKTIE